MGEGEGGRAGGRDRLGRGGVWDGALGGSGAAERAAAALAGCENFWCPRDALEAGPRGPAAPGEEAGEAGLRGVGEHSCRALLERVAAPLLAGQDWAGAEYWTQVYEPGNGLGFHFDKDERALEERGEMVFPLFSSVVYLTEARAGRAPLAPTVVMDQALVGGEMSPQRNTGTVLVHPKRDRALLFDGTLAHGVLESVNTTDVRKTLLVNWWKRRPEGIQRVEPEEVERHGLQFQPSADGKDAPAVPVETGQWQAPAAGTVPMVLVDDITGGGPDVAPFRFKHGGWSLYPMDNGAEENQAFSTLAVFVAESDEEEEEG